MEEVELPSTVKLDSVKFISREEVQRIKDQQKNRQIVANELKGREETPENSRFLGEKNQAYDRQVMARQNGSFKEAGKGKTTGNENSLAQKSESVKKVAKKAAPKKRGALSLSDLGGFTLKDLDSIEKEIEDSLKEAEQLAAQNNEMAKGIESGKLNVRGLAANNDHVEDIPLGEMTNLNTTEFKYYGFYHRIRLQLEQHWGSTIKDKARAIYRSGGRVPASESMITSITVTLDNKGRILDMRIDGTSGIRELDQAAIESFNKAGPFPNPPKGLLVGGRATIQWGFVVKG